jgi:hypothetical protein
MMEPDKTIVPAPSTETEASGVEPGTISLMIPSAFAVSGLAIGYVTGLSETPVIGTLLPLLFTAVTGGIGYIAIRRPSTSKRIGLSLALLSLFLIIGDTWGIALRTGLALRDFVWRAKPREAFSALAIPEIKDQQTLLLLAAVKVHLQNVNLPENERELIFRFATGLARDGDRTALISLNDGVERLLGPRFEETQPNKQTEMRSVVGKNETGAGVNVSGQISSETSSKQSNGASESSAPKFPSSSSTGLLWTLPSNRYSGPFQFPGEKLDNLCATPTRSYSECLLLNNCVPDTRFPFVEKRGDQRMEKNKGWPTHLGSCPITLR